MSRFFTLRNIVIALAIILIVSAAFFILGTFLQQPASGPQTQTGAVITPTTPVQTQTGVTIPTPSTTSPFLPSSPTVPTMVIPPGFSFPEDPSIRDFVFLEPILPSLTPDPTTEQLSITDKDLLYFQLSRRYYYDPEESSQIIEDPYYRVTPTIIDFGHFDPESMEVKTDEKLLWFNQNTVDCQLRTDPKSPQAINQKLGPQQSAAFQLTKPGIYVFFCQGLPGSTQTIVAS